MKFKEVDYITDMPEAPIMIRRLTARLAQANAIALCKKGDAIRIWACRHDNRVLIVVKNADPGIPDAALTKIFRRLYSHRPEEHFGNNSDLGPAIFKQVFGAHGEVIWAEKICPTEADITPDPLAARFVMGVPV
ncbi:MAG: hypothetical protein GDA36_03510 [Rhodobacteraceae bacterium]|nr:hypothetical protein [Paracoccaceae bacterium]